MKHLLLTTIAAVLVVGCGASVDIHQAATEGNIEAVKQHLAAGTNVDEKTSKGERWLSLVRLLIITMNTPFFYPLRGLLIVAESSSVYELI